MNNEIIGDFSVLSPSQKRELERKRKEKEARETAEAIRRAEAARKAREAAKLAEEKRLAAIRAENAAREAEKQTKRMLWGFLIVVLIVAMIVAIYYWYLAAKVWNGDDVWWGALILFIFPLGIAGAPILVILGSAIYGCYDKIKALK